MSRPTSALESATKPDARPDDLPRNAAPDRGWCVGEAIPAVLTDADLCRGLGFGHTQFYRRKAAGDFDFLCLRPQLPGGNTRYAGALVARWLRGEPVGQARVSFPNARTPQAGAVRGPARRPGRPRRSTQDGAGTGAAVPSVQPSTSSEDAQ